MQELHALVVEDDPDISSALVETLEGAGFRVTSALDGRQAVSAAAADPPDLVTLDLTLPHMDGIEVCRRIRESSDCYIVIVSARSDEVDKLIGLEVGADDFVLKPFSPRELRARVAALFRRPRTGTVTEEPVNGRNPQVPSPAQPVDEPSTINAGAGLSQTAEIEKTLLDTRVESSREIRQALAKPIPRPEPLGPVTAKLARSIEATKLAATPKLSKQARDAFASADRPAAPSGTYAVPDRHSSNF